MTILSAPHDVVLDRFTDDVGSSGPVAIEGNRTRWALGGTLDPDTRLISAPTGIVDHQPEEMTVRVRAGTTVTELDAVLAERGQRCALPDRAGTVGGAVVVGENHECVLGRGRLRSSVLQVRYASAEGRLIVGGGPTVKNVTGFDLPRLFVGSLGTLGAVAEVVLRVNPVPPCSAWMSSDDTDPFAIHAALWRPGALLWNGESTWVLLEGHGADVEAQRRELRRHGSFVEADGAPPLPPHRWSLRPSDLRRPPTEDAFVASIGVGTMWTHRPQPTKIQDPAVEALTARIKHNFDPDARLSPGRDPEAA